MSFTSLLVVAASAVAAPLAVGFFQRLRVPAAGLEITGGIIVGPSVLGWARIDLPVGGTGGGVSPGKHCRSGPAAG